VSEISDLFAKDPLSLTREDRDKIILHLRENRARYVAGVKAPKAVAKKAPSEPLNLDDLGL